MDRARLRGVEGFPLLWILARDDLGYHRKDGKTFPQSPSLPLCACYPPASPSSESSSWVWSAYGIDILVSGG